MLFKAAKQFEPVIYLLSSNLTNTYSSGCNEFYRIHTTLDISQIFAEQLKCEESKALIPN